MRPHSTALQDAKVLGRKRDDVAFDAEVRRRSARSSSGIWTPASRRWPGSGRSGGACTPSRTSRRQRVRRTRRCGTRTCCRGWANSACAPSTASGCASSARTWRRTALGPRRAQDAHAASERVSAREHNTVDRRARGPLARPADSNPTRADRHRGARAQLGQGGPLPTHRTRPFARGFARGVLADTCVVRRPALGRPAFGVPLAALAVPPGEKVPGDPGRPRAGTAPCRFAAPDGWRRPGGPGGRPPVPRDHQHTPPPHHSRETRLWVGAREQRNAP